ncbi:Crp/Fnr family transcriptional regulator [Mucilaginibacter myungsuensis]|uniref:Crp/Fnr family transcriptional regulator n=1 Tax=Mucilaginibacter myungsuensis TaxID=649104 RepID=A0A929L0Q5_9SPHI|nr:Crp/Fnr family transcriptional regulator [Mucilaginibacter myungsuensis]MBE9664112.1 Crp/Fnr family transcriptional regulator [Mucilaginibacter myungsuensis]MDN3601291.1 Crp/Fnr family transcriptional regulator [Mucilaginibacter myungsuensis]
MDKLRQHIEELSPLTDAEFDLIKPYFTYRRIKKHQYLTQEGDQSVAEYLILSGVFRMFHLDADGKEYIVQFAGENWWVADYQAYFKGKLATLHITCMEDAEVLCLNLNGREKLATEFHKMEHFFRMKLTNGYVALHRRILSLLSSTPQQRYEEFGQLYPQLMQKIPKKYIAEYLGVSRETLSRLYSNK